MSARILTSASFLLLLSVECPLSAQFPGGGYPYPGGSRTPGGYPTGPQLPVPRRGKDKTKDTRANGPQLHSLAGVLQKIDEAALTIVADDTRVITAKRSDKTKFLRSGQENSASSLRMGDRVRIEATQDDHGFFLAVTVYDDSPAVGDEKASAAPKTPAPDNQDQDRPVLRRNSDSAPAESDAPKTPVATAPECPEEPDPGPPRLRRGKPPVRKTTAPQQQTTPCVEPGTPEQQPQTVASANVPQWKTEPSEAAGAREDPRIAKAREAVSAHTESLPNYFCKQQVARYATTSQKADWQPLDVVSATVVFENGRDEYRDITVNGKPVKKRMDELGGAWSTGEFGMMAADLFSRATAAEFTPVRNGSIAGREAAIYNFEVDREHSHWSIQAPSQSMKPAYKGTVWLDAKTAEVLRIEMQTSRMPKEFPLDKVESAVDYESVRIGEQQFLLPVHAETLACVRGTPDCSRNVIDFRNYRKYAGQSTITFDK